jgi:hypothetical protein
MSNEGLYSLAPSCCEPIFTPCQRYPLSPPSWAIQSPFPCIFKEMGAPWPQEMWHLQTIASRGVDKSPNNQVYKKNMASKISNRSGSFWGNFTIVLPLLVPLRRIFSKAAVYTHCMARSVLPPNEQGGGMYPSVCPDGPGVMYQGYSSMKQCTHMLFPR